MTAVMQRFVIASIHAAIACSLFTSLPARAMAPAAATPDFSGVYFNVQNLGVLFWTNNVK
jgi:hypothetical protein